jgi:hypothetical protein
MSLRTKPLGSSRALPQAVPWLCLVSIPALVCAGCAGVTSAIPREGRTVSGQTSTSAGVPINIDNPNAFTDALQTVSVPLQVSGRAFLPPLSQFIGLDIRYIGSVRKQAGLISSGPVIVSGQNGIVIQGLHITNPNGDCATVTDSDHITIRQSEIGPCSGNGIVINGGNTINVFDNYIHPEGKLAGCCDFTDGIFAKGTANLTVGGNVIAYGEANIEAQNQTNLAIIGNFFLNPRNSRNRGQNIQVFYGSSNVLIENNYTIASLDTALYKFAENQEDSINFGGSRARGFTNGIIARNNYITGGHSPSGCGLIAETGANNARFLSNTLVDTGQCGIGIADGKNHVVDSNKVLNIRPVNGGGNTAIYVWKVNFFDPRCGPVQISNNIASAIASDGSANSFWNGGGCDPVTITNNSFDATAQQALSPATLKLRAPPIPPQPHNCVIASPFTHNASSPACASYTAGGEEAAPRRLSPLPHSPPS